MKDEEPLKAGYSPRFIIKFDDDFVIRYIDNAEKYLEGPEREQWDKLAAQFPRITLKRLYTVLSAEDIQALVERAKKSDPEYAPPNLLTYFLVDAVENISPDQMSQAFIEWPAVQLAYPDPEGVDPEVTPHNNSHFTDQHHLDPANLGIGAENVWPRAGGLGHEGADGAGVRLIDMEQGWTLDHEDLISHGASLLHGNNRVASRKVHRFKLRQPG